MTMLTFELIFLGLILGWHTVCLVRELVNPEPDYAQHEATLVSHGAIVGAAAILIYWRW